MKYLRRIYCWLFGHSNPLDALYRCSSDYKKYRLIHITCRRCKSIVVKG
jgi:hypothetical protein